MESPRLTNGTTENPWLSRYAALTALATFILICVGGLVTSHGAGLAVPDWPTTYGYNMFFFPISRWVGGIFYEHTHRLIASAVGFMTIILAAWLWVKEPRGWMRWLGTLALVGVTVQGVLGGLRVTQLMAELGIVHAALAQLFLGLVAGIALFSSRWWHSAQPVPATAASLRPWYIGLAALIFLQLVIAATMRHQHAGLAISDFPLAYGKVWPDVSGPAITAYNEARQAVNAAPVTAFQILLQMAHRLCAVMIFAGVLVTAWKTQNQLGGRSALVRLSWLQVIFIVAQIILGAATIWTNKSADIATTHVAVGALTLLNSIMLVLVLSRGLAVAKVAATEPVRPAPQLNPSPAISPA